MRGPITYMGGKSRLAERLIALFPRHTAYVEPFAGGAQVFFRKEPSRVEVLNDLDGELVNFLRICQLHHEELLRWLSYAVASRKLYELYQRQPPELLTDIQRAARFLYLQRVSWGGKATDQNYRYTLQRSGRFAPSFIRPLIEQAAKRLDRVQLENWPYEKVLERYDRPDTLFYCDPPYVDRPLYRFNFAREHFQALADRLKRIKGKFLLSINDHPVAREAFSPFHVHRLSVRYSGNVRHSHELVFANFPVPSAP